MASYFTGEIVGVKRKAPEVITMVNGYPHATYPAFDIVGKILWRNLSKNKYEVKVNNSNCILRVSDCDIFKIDYAEESEIFDSILLNDSLSQPYIYLGEFADHVLNKRQNKCHGFGGFTQLSKKELKYAEADAKAAKEAYAILFNKTPKYALAYDANLFDIDGVIKAHYSIKEITKMINNAFGVSGTYTWNLYKKIIFNGPCTIILWTDGSKTIAKTSDGEVFDPEKGVAICFMKKMIGHTEANKILRKASKQYEDYLTENKIYPTFEEFIEYLGSLKSETKPVDHIDQSTIEEVKKVEEKQDE